MSALRGVRRGLILGVAAVAWLSLWSRALDALVEVTFPSSLRGSPHNPFSGSPTVDVLVREELGLELGAGVRWTLVAIGVLASVLLAVVWEVVAPDRQRLGPDSLRWSIRRLGPAAVGIAGVVGVTLLVEQVFRYELPAYSTVALILASGIVTFIWEPLALLRPDFASEEDRRWWLPRWPGGSVLLAVFLLVLATDALGLALDQIGVRWGVLGIPLFILSVTLILAQQMLAAHLLVERVSIRSAPARLRELLGSKAFVGPWFSFLSITGLGLLALAVPVGAVYLWYWKVLPLASHLASESSLELPRFTSWAADLIAFGGAFVPELLLLPLTMIVDGGRARLVHLLGENRRHPLAAATTPAAQEPGGSLSPEGRL